jgi:hypothetical protein
LLTQGKIPQIINHEEQEQRLVEGREGGIRRAAELDGLLLNK